MTVEELIQLKHDLDKSSDLLNEKIVQYEEDLKKLGLGVQVWVKLSENTEIGYQKFEGEWSVVIRYDDFGEYKISRLLRSSRNLRLYGYKNINLLIPALEAAATVLLKKINKALNNEEDLEND